MTKSHPHMLSSPTETASFCETMRASTKHQFCSSILCLTLLTFIPLATSKDTLSSTQSLQNNQTLVSSGGVFELGLFKPSATSGWYLGIWYKNIQEKTVVWVANRDNPISNSSSATLKIGDHGNLVLLDGENGNITWSSNETQAMNPIVQLLDSGNLVLRDGNLNRNGPKDQFLWQSFDYPTDTLLPDMKLGWNLSSSLDRYITSWKSTEDPSTGDISFKLDYRGFPEIFLRKKQSITYRSGPWNGERFSGVPEMTRTDGIQFNFVANSEEVYYSFSVRSNSESFYSRLIVNPNGELQRLTWIESRNIWNKFWYAPKDQCDDYSECGPYGICDSNASPVCKCLKGFEPKNLQTWDLRDGSDGCVRKTDLECSKDKFLALGNMKLAESGGAFVDMNMSLEACKKKCLENCSCTAYSDARISVGEGSGCVMWTGDLLDMRQYAEGGQHFYVRLAASELDGDGKTKRLIMIVGIVVGVGILLAGLAICFVWKRKLAIMNRGRIEQKGPNERSQDFLLDGVVITSKKENYSGERGNDELELPLLDFSTVAVATDNFSDENQLGQGGFGCVYKGTLVEGEVVAIKRLSKNSGQGTEEFKNEVKLIARLQHRNLVRLLGCCIDTDEKMLIYEYMENKSLDSVLFSQAKRSMLDWQKRFEIICGIARGLLYLHQDSRFRIIHRDLKASNILLDGELTPKISDFGMARIFGRDQTEANTRRVVGTYGYMSPEYAMDGLFSIKSDVFSFGVLVLEIISGKKNRGFYYSNNELNLLGHAWKLWTEGKGLEIIDPSVGDSYSPSEVLRCMQVGLLCVQERAEDRPTMSSVVLMLSSETATMPQPKNPGFCLERNKNPLETDSSSSKQDQSCTVNHVTVTMLDGR
ncbi:PREDICTED: receptor [Prunus dulcis]|uniref:Receptor-like serine/threonine-protein kinase n=1 Tax=Prunus dulcis TaxID=3755 RepID=A0A5E4G2J4_PRUDU|nr:receptor-like serine/threonine-protein kinase SD1-8 [Prunus dulcis]VVA33926.1 PREDICTED: receptor [Prunus dulcis]